MRMASGLVKSEIELPLAFDESGETPDLYHSRRGDRQNEDTRASRLSVYESVYKIRVLAVNSCSEPK